MKLADAMRVIENKSPSQLWGELRLAARAIMARHGCMVVMRCGPDTAATVLALVGNSTATPGHGILIGGTSYAKFVQSVVEVWPNMPLAQFREVLTDAENHGCVPVLWFGVRPIQSNSELLVDTGATLGIISPTPVEAGN